MPRVAFNNLPSHVQEKLRDWHSGADGSVVFPEAGSHAPIVACATSAIWLIVLFSLSYSFRWSSAKIVIFAIVTAVAGYFIVQALTVLFRLKRRESRNCLVVTPGHVFEFRDGELEYRTLDTLVTIQENHQYENGQYKRTRITLAFDDGSPRAVYVNDINVAEDAIENISLYKKRYLEMAARGNPPEFELDQMISGYNGHDAVSGRPVEKLRKLGIPVLGGVVVAVASMTVAVVANEYFDDVKSWNAAQTSDGASNYRNYLRTHPSGRWSRNAGSRLQALYDNAESRYKASLNDGHDQAAVTAVSSLLRYARETGNYQVQVIFDRRAEISENMIEEIKEDFGVKRVLPLGDSFSNEKMLARESALVGVLSQAVREVFPEDILEITQGSLADCSEALIVYETTFRDSIYYSTEEKDLPEKDRTYKPGILINWTFRIAIPKQSGMYEFTLESVPASTIYHDTPPLPDGVAPVGGTMSDVEKNSLYDAMVASAFEDFRRNLVFKLGIGPEPTPQVDQFAEGGTANPETLRLGDSQTPNRFRQDNTR